MKYAIVFTDFKMPIMDGIDMAEKIREYECSTEIEIPTTIIGVTGHVQESIKNEGTKAGMNEIYSKPLYSNILNEILHKYNLFKN